MDVVRPGPLNPAQRLADRLDLGAAEILLIQFAGNPLFQLADPLDHVHGLGRKPDADRTPVVRGALLFQVAHFRQLLDVVGNI